MAIDGAKGAKLFQDMLLSVGAMKAGTSWLAKQLEEHPDIFMTPLKEVHYFAHTHTAVKFLDENGRREALRSYASWLDAEKNFNTIRAHLKWFRAYLSDPINDAWFYNLYKDRGAKRYCAEFSNLNSALDDEAWKHILNLCDNVKVLYTLRDPLERTWSHVRFQSLIDGTFAHLVNWTESDYRDFLGLTDILQQTRYSKAILAMRRNLDPDQFLLLYFEDFRADPLGELRNIEKFLSISRRECYEHLDFQNKTPSLEMPKVFPLAAREVVMEELEALSRLGVRVPEGWTSSMVLGSM